MVILYFIAQFCVYELIPTLLNFYFIILFILKCIFYFTDLFYPNEISLFHNVLDITGGTLFLWGFFHAIFRCVPEASFCDGVDNCRDNSDEDPERYYKNCGISII